MEDPGSYLNTHTEQEGLSMSALRIVHYLNQFFAGIGGEEKADTPAHLIKKGPVGPGVPLQKALGDEAAIVGTVVCGDNYFTERQEEALALILQDVEGLKPDVLVAGPAFSAGRYGIACTAACAEVHRAMSIPVVTAMHPQNPGVEQHRPEVYILPTTPTAAGMGEVIPALARMAIRLGRGESLGPAAQEGYLPRGVRNGVNVGTPAAERAVDMLLSRLKGEPFEPEINVPEFEYVPPPPPLPELSRATIAVVTESGLVPYGNPDRLETWNASKWLHYSLVGVSDLRQGEYEAWHGGCDTRWTNDDPDRVVPLDGLRQLEREGLIGRLHEEYYVTTGNMSSISTMTRLGGEMAQELKRQGVDAVLLVAT